METKKTTELAATNDTITSFKNLDEIQAFGDRIAKSEISPLKEGKDVVAAVLLGRELGLPPMVSINNIYPINGKGTLSVHIINALLQRNGVVVEIVRNFEPCVNFALKADGSDKAVLFDGSGNLIAREKDGSVPKDAEGNLLGMPMILREGFVDEHPKENEVKSTRITNTRTIVRFTRQILQKNGSYVPMIIESSYSLAEAQMADLYGNPKKENWNKYPKQMLLNRALAFGGRLIGADILLGMYETSEMADANHIPYKVVDTDHIEIITEKKDKNTYMSSTPVTDEQKGEETSESNDNANEDASHQTN